MSRQQESWGYKDNDVLLYMEKLADELEQDLRSATNIKFKVEKGFHKLKKEEIGEHVYYTQTCKSLRNYAAIYHPDEELKKPRRHVWRIYFGCGTPHQRWDVASLVSTIQDGQVG